MQHLVQIRALAISGLSFSLAACAGGSRGPAAENGSSPSAAAASVAARALLTFFDSSARATAQFSLDSPERTSWFYIPRARAGVPLTRMTAPQRRSLDALLLTGLSSQGHQLAERIIRHEAILGALEASASPGGTRIVRDSGLYYLTLFGTPSDQQPWGWRFEGHHLSVNVTRVGGSAQVVAPVFMGVSPARVPSGPKAGLRLLAAEEDLGRALVLVLDARQLARAIIADTAFPDIVTRNDPAVRPFAMAGLSAAEMSPDQRDRLRLLIETYAARMAPEARQEQLARIEAAGFERLHFAWAGRATPGEAHYYRIHGPTVLIEYDNRQNNANHIHTVWRDLQRDFGGDLLREHYQRHRHEAR